MIFYFVTTFTMYTSLEPSISDKMRSASYLETRSSLTKNTHRE
jgi:hypothetical protein